MDRRMVNSTSPARDEPVCRVFTRVLKDGAELT
jgi:hypothetical protein